MHYTLGTLRERGNATWNFTHARQCNLELYVSVAMQPPPNASLRSEIGAPCGRTPLDARSSRDPPARPQQGNPYGVSYPYAFTER